MILVAEDRERRTEDHRRRVLRRPSGVVLGDLDEKSQPSRKLCGTQSEGFVRAFVETADRDKAFVAGAPEQRVDKDFQLVAVWLEHGSIDIKTEFRRRALRSSSAS